MTIIDQTGGDDPGELSATRIGNATGELPGLRTAVERFLEIGDLTAEIAVMLRDAALRPPKIDLAEIRTITASWFDEVGRRSRSSAKAQMLLEAGWVPFAGMPLADIADDASPEKISSHMEALISGRWEEVREALIATVTASRVDEEAGATFAEALDAFEGGHFRSVVRVLFPEIERVAGETVYGGSCRDWSFDQGQKKRGLNTGLGGLREALMRHLPAGLGTHADFGFSLTQKMDSHLYRYVGTDPDELAALRADPIPNRHASQHGYVTYASSQNAYNALAMTAFMFEIIMRVHRYLEKSAAKGGATEDPAVDTRSPDPLHRQ